MGELNVTIFKLLIYVFRFLLFFIILKYKVLHVICDLEISSEHTLIANFQRLSVSGRRLAVVWPE